MSSVFQPLAALLAKALNDLHPAVRVASPGSRNAPLIEAFSLVPGKEVVVLDERAAAYMALGAAIQTGKPAVAYCTSGTAGLNYAPAIAEAFYQRVPLLVITADRPAHLIDQGHGQSIRQSQMYAGHLRGQALLDASASLESQVAAVGSALQALSEGPVHINIPFDEPLYGTPIWPESHTWSPWSFHAQPTLELMLPEWIKEAHRPLLVLGQWNPAWGSAVRSLEQLKAKGWLVAAEHLANLPASLALHLEDAWVHAPAARVDAVVTLGGAWIAKESKKRLAGTPHWHIGSAPPHPDVFGSLVEATEMAPLEAMRALATVSPVYEPSWARIWVQQRSYPATRWSDRWVHEYVSRHSRSGMDIHWANSTAVRYGLHTWAHGGWVGDYRHYSNRGASGIDGCTSTAMGSAWLSERPTLLITGELAFHYDINAWIHGEIPAHFKVLVLHNGGGNIFRWIPGPKSSQRLDSHFTWAHQRSSEALAAHAGVAYRACADMADFPAAYQELLESPEAAILEVFTDAEVSEHAWKNRFQP
jgi:2-succinyl-5-enolpyruvyl-6-hydroxy-3-cyclohexene-1-carboxylate synthase